MAREFESLYLAMNEDFEKVNLACYSYEPLLMCMYSWN